MPAEKRPRVALPIALCLSLLAALFFEYGLALPLGGAAAHLWAAGKSLLYALVAWLLLCLLGVPRVAASGRSALACSAVCLSFALALANLPWSPLLHGRATVTADGGTVLALLLSCLATALFEELLFRRLLFAALLYRLGTGRRGCFLAILLSSLLFGASHVLNLFAGAGPAAVLLQVGYSFLIGCMAAALYRLTGCLALPVAFHALYNFCGFLIPQCGTGILWDGATLALTLLLSAASLCVIPISVWRTVKK